MTSRYPMIETSNKSPGHLTSPVFHTKCPELPCNLFRTTTKHFNLKEGLSNRAFINFPSLSVEFLDKVESCFEVNSTKR